MTYFMQKQDVTEQDVTEIVLSYRKLGVIETLKLDVSR